MGSVQGLDFKKGLHLRVCVEIHVGFSSGGFCNVKGNYCNTVV